MADHMVTGLFANRADAERAYGYAAALGHDSADISVLMSDATRQQLFNERPGQDTALASKAADAAESAPTAKDNLGGPVGGTMGTLAPVLAAVGTLLLIPGLGIVAAGPVAIALTAAGAVGVAGGLIGAMTQWGVPKNRVEEYEAGIREGNILLGVKALSEQDARQLVQQWQASGGRHLHS
jgi:hypothetical protein